MARFDVHRRRDDETGYLLDVQADILSSLSTRLIVPLIPGSERRRIAARLNPVFEIEGAPHVMLTEFASAMLVSDVGGRVTSLAAEHAAIIGALDVLLTGV